VLGKGRLGIDVSCGWSLICVNAHWPGVRDLASARCDFQGFVGGWSGIAARASRSGYAMQFPLDDDVAVGPFHSTCLVLLLLSARVCWAADVPVVARVGRVQENLPTPLFFRLLASSRAGPPFEKLGRGRTIMFFCGRSECGHVRTRLPSNRAGHSWSRVLPLVVHTCLSLTEIVPMHLWEVNHTPPDSGGRIHALGDFV